MPLPAITQSFRRAKFGSAVALSITSAIAAFPSAASAMELSDVTLQTNCRAAALDRISTGAKLVVGWDLLCADRQLKIAKQQEYETKQELERVRQQEKAIDVLSQCVDKLKQFRAAQPDAFRALGTITRENACAAASRIPVTAPVATGAKPSAG